MLRLLAAAHLARAYNNGLGRTPPLGWSSWYCSPLGSQVTDAFVRANAEALITSGLAAKGYVQVNVDEGWLAGRHANGSLYEDLAKFPQGMAALGAWVRAQPVAPGSAQRLRYGLYSCRGTCQCSTSRYSGPGGQGHEAADTAWMVAAGAQWIKIDSCCGSQDPATAFADYGRWRDAMNSTGVPVFFNLCGWREWYAPPNPALNYSGGASLGNSWRIWGDGGSWPAITGAINALAALADYNAPYGFNDPDNILGPHGTVGAVTEAQARVQMILWCLAPTQLILGEDLTQASAEYLQTVGNEELIAVNQDWPFAGPARRVAGGDLASPCADPSPGALFAVHALPCNASDGMQAWGLDGASGRVALLGGSGGGGPPLGYLTLGAEGCASGGADGSLVYVAAAGGGGAPAGCDAQAWRHAPANNSLLGPFGKCLDEYMFTTPRVDLWACQAGASNEAWAPTGGGGGGGGVQLVNGNSGLCLAAAPLPATSCTNVWARPLASGAVALGLVSNLAAPAVVTCDAACFAAAGVTASAVAVRDLIAHKDLGVLHAPLSVSVALQGGGGDGGALLITPQ